MPEKGDVEEAGWGGEGGGDGGGGGGGGDRDSGGGGSDDENDHVPTQLATFGAKTTMPLLVAAAPENAPTLVTELEMLGHENKLVVGLKMPTQLAKCGVKTTRPVLVRTAPRNFGELEVGVCTTMLRHEKVAEIPYEVPGVKMPTQLAVMGAKMTRPSTVAAAPSNLADCGMPTTPTRLTGHEKLLVYGLKTPTQLALYGANTTSPVIAVAAPRNFIVPLLIPVMLGHDMTLVDGLNTPTQLASYGAKTTTPLTVAAAPKNRCK